MGKYVWNLIYIYLKYNVKTDMWINWYKKTKWPNPYITILEIFETLFNVCYITVIKLRE